MTTAEDRAEWLEWRRGGIGASDAAAVLGVSPWKTPLQLYLEKRGESPLDTEPTGEHLEIGTALEPALATLYGQRTGREIVRTQVRLEYPLDFRIRCTLDGIDSDGNIVEFKVSSAQGWGPSGTDQIPEYYRTQALHQCLCYGVYIAFFGVLYEARSFRIYGVTFTPEEISQYLTKAKAFLDAIESGTPPEPTFPQDSATVAALAGDSREVAELDEAAGALWERRDEALFNLKRWEKAKKEYEKDLLKWLGTANFGRFPDGRAIRRRLVKVPAGTVERKAYHFAVLESVNMEAR